VQWAGDPEATAEAVRAASGGGVDYAVEASGRPEAAEAAFLATRTRGAAVLVGIPRAGADLRLPALAFPRTERRVLGSAYGSMLPARDFPTILAAYRSGRLPLDRLISHRLALEEVEDAFDLLRSGGARRVVLQLRRDGEPPARPAR
jgi:Zn-dependent alcohol dehydrogenase